MLRFMGRPSGSVCMLCGADLWGVKRYVTAGVIAVCAPCVETMKRALDDATSDGEIEVIRPANVFGSAPDDEAPTDVARAFVRTFGSDYDALDDYVEDADELGPLLQQGAQSRGGAARFSVRVDAIRFPAPDLAEVRFQILMDRNPAGAFEGTAVKGDGHWRVTRSTAARLLATVGVNVHPHARPPDHA